MSGVLANVHYEKNRAQFRLPPGLEGMELYRAHLLHHAFEPYSHDAFGLGIIDAGAERFRYRGALHLPPPIAGDDESRRIAYRRGGDRRGLALSDDLHCALHIVRLEWRKRLVVWQRGTSRSDARDGIVPAAGGALAKSGSSLQSRTGA